MTSAERMDRKAPEHSRLAAGLSELKERTGLSLAALAAQTAYSKSSWERYLNGKALPPREAIRALCWLADEPEGRFLALWEIAESAWRGRAAEATRTSSQEEGKGEEREEGNGSGPEARRLRARPMTVGVALALTCAVGALGAVAVALLRQDGGPEPPVAVAASGAACRGADCDGKNPIDTRCATGPDTLATHRTTTGASMDIRYSEECGATWARVWDSRIGDRIEITVGDRTRTVEVTDDLDVQAYVFTFMAQTRPGVEARACFWPVGGGARECFAGRVEQPSAAGSEK